MAVDGKKNVDFRFWDDFTDLHSFLSIPVPHEFFWKSFSGSEEDFIHRVYQEVAVKKLIPRALYF